MYNIMESGVNIINNIIEWFKPNFLSYDLGLF